MKRIEFLILLFAVCLSGFSQQLNVKTVNLRPNDARARTNPRDDAKGNKCAIIRVGVVGVDDLVFPDAVGDVEHTMSEYVVYVQNGLKKFKYKNKSGKIQGTIDFDEWGLEVSSLSSYDVVFETDNHMRTAIFSIAPTNAKVTFNNQKIKVDNNGMAMVNMPPGEYLYSVEANGYQGASGVVTLTEDDISTTTYVSLEQIKHRVILRIYPKSASAFIDNEPITNDTLYLSEGSHSLRVTSPKYEDKEKIIDVNQNLIEHITLKEVKTKIVKHKEERTKTSISVRGANYINIGFAMLGVSNLSKITDKDNAWDFNLEYSHIYHFAGIMGVRLGFGGGLIKSNKNEKYIKLAYDKEIDSLLWILHADIPLQIGVSLPFGKYNQHLLRLYGGGYGKILATPNLIKEEYIAPDDELVKDLDEENNRFDYGIRVNASFDIGHFTIGAELNQSLNEKGFSAGVNIGWKFYRNKKE